MRKAFILLFLLAFSAVSSASDVKLFQSPETNTKHYEFTLKPHDHCVLVQPAVEHLVLECLYQIGSSSQKHSFLFTEDSFEIDVSYERSSYGRSESSSFSEAFFDESRALLVVQFKVESLKGNIAGYSEEALSVEFSSRLSKLKEELNKIEHTVTLYYTGEDFDDQRLSLPWRESN